MQTLYQSWTRRHIGAGVAILSILLNLMFNPFHLENIPMRMSNVALLMLGCWIFELLPMPVVALFPIVLFPLLGIESLGKTAAPYADPVIFLFMGGFFIALAIEKWGLHKRIAMNIIARTGMKGNQILLGFMVATFMISMWISNTATTLMMFPIVLSVLKVIQHQYKPDEFAKLQTALLLSIAYASNIGGLATIVGTPPNTAYVGYALQNLNIRISFFEWTLICFPIALLILYMIYLAFTKWLFRGQQEISSEAENYLLGIKRALGPWTQPEKRVMLIFLAAAFLWMTKDVWVYLFKLDLSDTGIAIFCAILLFVIPSGSSETNLTDTDFSSDKSSYLLTWEDTHKMAWGILILFGGGLTMAKGLESTGIMQRIGDFLAAYAPNQLVWLIFMVAVISILLSEVMSNIAQVMIMAPILTSVSYTLELNPLILGIPMTLAASCAGMLPMGTPPNAIVFSSGKIPLRSMLKVGLVINVISVIMITLLTYCLIPILTGTR